MKNLLKLSLLKLILIGFGYPLQAAPVAALSARIPAEETAGKPCEQLRVQQKKFCFTSQDFYKKEVPVIVVLSEEEKENLKLQVFKYSTGAGQRLVFAKVFEEDGMGLKLLSTFNESGGHPFILQDLNQDGQLDLAFAVEIFPRHQLILFSYDPKNDSFGYLLFNDPSVKTPKDDGFEFNFVPQQRDGFPFISADGRIQLPIACIEGTTKMTTSQCPIQEYKSLQKGSLSLTTPAR